MYNNAHGPSVFFSSPPIGRFNDNNENVNRIKVNIFGYVMLNYGLKHCYYCSRRKHCTVRTGQVYSCILNIKLFILYEHAN